jgi:uncharacterized protein (DUF111 family)
VKLGRLDGEIVQVAPEFDACRDKAVQAGVPVRTVMAAAEKLARTAADSTGV